jgi:hypothetical protein
MKDTARIARAIARFTADAAAIEERLATLRAECPSAAIFEAHPEVAWQRGRAASVDAMLVSLRAELR